MIYAFLAILGLLGVYFVRENDNINKNLKYVVIGIALIFLVVDTYTYLILPDQIDSFYNSGAGITYNNATYFDDNDFRIGYFFSQVSNDYTWMEWLRNLGFFIGSIMLLLLAFRYLKNFNSSGERIGK